MPLPKRLLITLAATGVAVGCHARSPAASPRPSSSAPNPIVVKAPEPASSATVPNATSSAGAPAPAVEAPVASPRIVDLRKAAKQYDFRLVLGEDCREPQVEGCEAAADVVVFAKGSSTALATLNLETLLVDPDRGATPMVLGTELDGYQGTIIAADFDFDGDEDFALHMGNDGPYGGPTYSVFLRSSRKPAFVHSEELTRLTQERLGLFEIDARRKRLLTSAKSGCCYHVYEELQMIGGRPVPVYRVTVDALTGDNPVEITERLLKGRWQRVVRPLKEP